MYGNDYNSPWQLKVSIPKSLCCSRILFGGFMIKWLLNLYVLRAALYHFDIHIARMYVI